MQSAAQFLDDAPSAEAFLDDSAEAFLDSDEPAAQAATPSLRPAISPPGGSSLATVPAGTPVSALEVAATQTAAPRQAIQAEAAQQAALEPHRVEEAFAQPVGGALPQAAKDKLIFALDTAIQASPLNLTISPEFRRGLAEEAVETTEGMRSMQGLLMMAGASIPGAAGIPGKAAISGIMAKDAGTAAGEASVVLPQGDNSREAGRLALRSLLAAGGAVGLAAHTGLARAKAGTPAGIAAATAERARVAGLEESAAALDQLSWQVESSPVKRFSDPLQAATSEGRPIGDLLATPEALRRSQELQLTEVPAATPPEGMVKTASRFDDLLPRNILLQLDETAMEAVRLAFERRAERATRSQGGKLETGGQTFPEGGFTPKFAESAEQRVSQRSPPIDPDTPPPPDITSSTPLKTVEDIVRGQLERRDWVNAVATLGQAKAEVSRKVVDNLLGVGREAVPLQAGERMIFNEIWERALEKAGARQAMQPVPEQVASVAPASPTSAKPPAAPPVEPPKPPAAPRPAAQAPEAGAAASATAAQTLAVPSFYHWTPKAGFKALRKGSHIGTLEQAIDIRKKKPSDEGRLFQVYLDQTNFKRVQDLGGNERAWAKELDKALAEGYAGLVYENFHEGTVKTERPFDSYIAVQKGDKWHVVNKAEAKSETFVSFGSGDTQAQAIAKAKDFFRSPEGQRVTPVDSYVIGDVKRVRVREIIPDKSLISRLESLRAPMDPGLGSTPFPQIAKAVWNTSIDIAIAAVKAGASIKAAIEAAISHLKKNAQGFDEAAVRSHMERIVKAEGQAVAGARAATEVAELPASQPQAATVPAVKPGQPAPAKPSQPAKPGPRPIGTLYGQPLVERLTRLGGPVSRKVSQENQGIISRAKQYYGNLASTILDPAKRFAAKAFRGGTTWIHGLRELAPHAAVSRFHDVIETRARTGNWDHVPSVYRPLASTLYDANLGIGHLAKLASPAFDATGRLQRILSSYGYEVVRRGRGWAWNAWTEALAKANNISLERTQAFFRKWKAQLDKPGIDATHLDRIAQDFKRHFPNVVTHIRPIRGLGWHEVIRSSPFDYLEQAAQRTAHAVAFREVYPLVQHEGKWVSSGKLEATRQAVQRELRTDKHATEFDNVMQALQGHPLDSYRHWWNAPDSPLGIASQAWDAGTRPIRALMLSASSLVNIGETVSGGPQIFLGYGNAFKGIIQGLRLYDQLKRSGMLNAAIRDFSFDPSQPVRSLSRQSANTISRAFWTDFMNEFQEYTAASAARIVANEIRLGTASRNTKTRIANTIRAMGIDKKSALQAVEGRNEPVLQTFETKSAEFLGGGNKALAEQSRWGASRVFQDLFWFHSYPMTKFRQLGGIMNNIIEDAATRDVKGVYHNSKLLGRYVGGTALGGGITYGIMKLIYEGTEGVAIAADEAQDDPTGFLWELAKTSMGGPLVVANRILERGLGADTLGTELLGASTAVGLARELSDASSGSGRYEGTDTFERLGLFLQSKTPISRAFKQGMAAFGLSQDNVKLDASIKAFYKWRRDKFGFVKRESFLEGDDAKVQFRATMRRAVEALKDGNVAEFDNQVSQALADPEVTPDKVSSSLQRSNILKTPDGKPLTPEEFDELRNRIGIEAADRLELFDEMLKVYAN